MINPKNTFLPKLDFFGSVGFSRDDLASIFSSQPSLLNRSLEKFWFSSIISSISVHVSNEGAMKFLKKTSWCSSGETIAANTAVLRKIGVPLPHISCFVVRYHTIAQKSDKFSENVNKVVEMGFDPLKYTFVNALQVFGQISESNWQQKMEIYWRWPGLV